MFFKSLSKKITFSCEPEFYNSILPPVPAKKEIPEWYKSADIYADSSIRKPIILRESGQSLNLSFKKCIPFLDALVSGYYIRLDQDVVVSHLENNEIQFVWPTGPAPINVHPYEQVKDMKNNREFIGKHVYKWMNHWYIETPSGYSVLVTHPMNRRETRFETFPAIIDTDKWQGTINFPFFWRDKNFEGIIEKGTVIAQVIPFKREQWAMDLKKGVKEKYRLNQRNLLTRAWNAYKDLFWSKKNYK
jgi:hypothetical protein